MWLTLGVIMVIASPFIGYYFDYRTNPGFFVSELKDMVRNYFSLIMWMGAITKLAAMLAKYLEWKI